MRDGILELYYHLEDTEEKLIKAPVEKEQEVSDAEAKAVSSNIIWHYIEMTIWCLSQYELTGLPQV